MEAELPELLGGQLVDLHTPQNLSRYFRDEVHGTAEGSRMRAEDWVRIPHMIDACESAMQFIAGRACADLDNNRMLSFAG